MENLSEKAKQVRSRKKVLNVEAKKANLTEKANRLFDWLLDRLDESQEMDILAVRRSGSNVIFCGTEEFEPITTDVMMRCEELIKEEEGFDACFWQERSPVGVAFLRVSISVD